MFTSYELTRAVVTDRQQQALGQARHHRLARVSRRAHRRSESPSATPAAFKLYRFPDRTPKPDEHERRAAS